MYETTQHAHSVLSRLRDSIRFYISDVVLLPLMGLHYHLISGVQYSVSSLSRDVPYGPRVLGMEVSHRGRHVKPNIRKYLDGVEMWIHDEFLALSILIRVFPSR